MSDETVNKQWEEILEERVYLSSEREQERNREAYRNTILKEARRLQKKQHHENALLLRRIKTKS